MSLAQDIRNAYENRSRDELERCMRLVDGLERRAASAITGCMECMSAPCTCKKRHPVPVLPILRADPAPNAVPQWRCPECGSLSLLPQYHDRKCRSWRAGAA